MVTGSRGSLAGGARLDQEVEEAETRAVCCWARAMSIQWVCACVWARKRVMWTQAAVGLWCVVRGGCMVQVPGAEDDTVPAAGVAVVFSQSWS